MNNKILTGMISVAASISIFSAIIPALARQQTLPTSQIKRAATTDSTASTSTAANTNTNGQTNIDSCAHIKQDTSEYWACRMGLTNDQFVKIFEPGGNPKYMSTYNNENITKFCNQVSTYGEMLACQNFTNGQWTNANFTNRQWTKDNNYSTVQLLVKDLTDKKIDWDSKGPDAASNNCGTELNIREYWACRMGLKPDQFKKIFMRRYFEGIEPKSWEPEFEWSSIDNSSITSFCEKVSTGENKTYGGMLACQNFRKQNKQWTTDNNFKGVQKQWSCYYKWTYTINLTTFGWLDAMWSWSELDFDVRMETEIGEVSWAYEKPNCHRIGEHNNI